MKPILYSSAETQFTSNGLGRLSDAISCVVEEERNSTYELKLVYPLKGIHYNDIKLERLIFAKPADAANPQPFRIYRITKPINGKVSVYAQHISYDLNGIPVSPFSSTSPGDAAVSLKTHSMLEHNFNVTIDGVSGSSECWTDIPRSFRSMLGGEEGSLLDKYGGEFEWDVFDVILHQNRGSDNGVTIRYGKNLTDLEAEIDIQDVYTGCVAFYLDDSGNYVESDIQYSEDRANYAQDKIYILDVSGDYSEEALPTEEDLNTVASSYITNNNLSDPTENLTISFVPLWQTLDYAKVAPLERVSLCDTVHIFYKELGVTSTAKVIRTCYDVLAERYTEIEIGEAKSDLQKTLTQGVRDTLKETIKPVTSYFQQKLDEATNLIWAGYGSHLYWGTNAAGQINELYFLDTTDIATAVNVLRINGNGIGFSNDGYWGTFNSAWTIDGTLNMGQINVVNLIADMINGGTLKMGYLGDQQQSAGVIILVDETNREFARLDKNGIKVFANNGDYVLMNAEVGFAGYNSSGQKIYWADANEFHMKEAVVEEKITVVNKLSMVPVEITDSDNNVVNSGVAFVATLNN